MIRNYNNVSSSPNIFNSPVGKFLVEDDHHDSPINHLMTSPSPKQNKSTIFMSQPNKLTPDTPVSKTLMTNNVKKKLCFSQPSNLSEGNNIIHILISYVILFFKKDRYLLW